ncbi:TPA: antA/AntB antirepressor family protein [Neisseria meningitidis]
MNTQLIPTVSGQLDNQTQALVDAHDLHKFLGVETPFSKWIQRRIEEYGFTQALDFIGVDKIVRTEAGFFGQRDKTVQGYYLSLYFIEMEKQAKALPDAVLYRIDALEDAYFQAAPEMLALLRYRSMGLNLTEIGKLLDMNPGAVSYRLKKLNDLGFLEYVPKPKMVVQQQSLGLEG